MKEVNVITSRVSGSPASHVNMHNEIHGSNNVLGLANFFLMVNSADIYNPMVKLLTGQKIDVDNLLNGQMPDYWEPSILIANNPVITAHFFDIFILVFIGCVLDYLGNREWKEGVLGVVKAYYGYVEVQGCGTLHCHMLVWLEGGLNPDTLKECIVADPSFGPWLVSMV